MIACMAVANTARMKIIELIRFSTALLLLSIPLQSIAQSNRTSGSIFVMEDGKKMGLPGASVIWAGTTSGTTTDIQGKFELDKHADSDSLLISYTGYQSVKMKYEGSFSLTLKAGVELKGVDIISRESSTALFLLDPLNIQRIDSRELRKAACCNLSESFETNASIDASFTDAITGTRQIKMLGLSGRYSQILKDNIPNIRGLSTVYGLGYIPGDWISDIHISKGAGSVTSGYESMTGEINVAIKDPDFPEKAHFNLYGNQGGRVEFNANSKWKVSDSWSTIVLAHAELNELRMDNNGDGFMDNPLKKDYVLRNQWKFNAKNHWEGQYAINYLKQDESSGQMDFLKEGHPNLWGLHLLAERMEASAKTGYIFDDKWGSSIGSQVSYEQYSMDLDAGLKNFSGTQNTFRANLLYHTNIANEKNGITVGITMLQDEYDMNLDSLDLSRKEQVVGGYAEYTWNPSERFSSIVGMRVDEHNLFGTLFSPRFHLRYSLTEDLSLKAATGRGYRTSNPVTDNMGLLASNRSWEIQSSAMQESAWNFGMNLTYKFRIDYRDASIAVDGYSTRFDKAAVIDYETPGAVNVYALNGESFSNTGQIEFGWEIMRRTDIRLAYRYTHAETDYLSGRRLQPFNPEHRGFFNISYETKTNEKEAQWKIDGTLQFIGEQRLPDLDHEDQTAQTSPAFLQVHGQVSRIFKKGLEAYLGVENATNYKQKNPIYSSSDPFNEAFDASQIWAPVFGTMGYLGLRWTIF
jgi:outer membrane receptor for ferrienterochelin and colicins